jgi:putative oxidoreductase
MGTAAAPPNHRIRLRRSRLGQAHSRAGGFARLLEQIGAPLPEATAWVSTFIEILGGLAILAGAFVAVVSIPLIVMMLVAMFTVHLRYGFSAINTIGLTPDGPQFGPPGYEVNLLYIAALIALILGGAGLFSIDGLLARRKREAAGSSSSARAAPSASLGNNRAQEKHQVQPDNWRGASALRRTD